MQSPNVHREAAYSIVQSELEKVDRIRRKRVSPAIGVAVDVIAEFLAHALEEVEDAYDLKTLRSRLAVITFFLNTVLRSIRDTATYWAMPLIRECYTACGIDPEQRTITIVQAQENETYSVIPNIIGILRRQINLHEGSERSKVWERWEKEHPIIDIFTIPAEARYDIASIAMIGHEVGHIYWVTPSGRNFLARKIDSFGEKVSEPHLEEYLSDEVARFLLGPAFDFAMVKLLVSMPLDASLGCATHPSSESRIRRCLESLRGYRSGSRTSELSAKAYLRHEELNTCLDHMIGALEKAVDRHHPEEAERPIDRATARLAADIIADPGFKHKRATFNCSLLAIWTWIRPELDAMRPPFEHVTRDAPIAISPRRAVIGVSLYYYSGAFATNSNEYYAHSDKSDTERIAFIRRTLVNQLKYAVGLHDFVKKAQERYCGDNFENTDWDRGLWDMRERKEGAPLAVVPSIHPREQYGPHSIDLRLGNSFLINRLTKFAYIGNRLLRGGGDPASEGAHIKNFYDELYLPVGDEFILHPHQFILASTLEYVSMPGDYYGLVLGRSSWGRLGLNIAAATMVQAGFKGCLTLELRNLGETPLSLKVGLRIAQLTLSAVPEHKSKTSYLQRADKYIGSVSAEVSKLHSDPDWDILD
ncbi:MAG: dCTP deaminase [Acidobacteriota bacterium]|nr:dCTP deaminase [Acidobacteriota bacterium]